MGILSGYKPSSPSAARPTVEQRALAAGIDPNLTPQEIEAREQPSAGGFVENIFGDIREIGQGLTSLISAAGADVWDLGKEVATLGEADTDGYNLATIAREAPGAIAEDYKTRYGEDWKRQLYENPLSYVGDALGVATLGGYTAARGAQMASRLPSVQKGLSALAAGDEAGVLARTVDNILPGLKAGEGAWAGGTRDIVNPLTHRVETVNKPFNPVRRFASDRIWGAAGGAQRNLLSRQVEELDEAVEMQGGSRLAERRLVNDLALKRNTLRLADESGAVIMPKALAQHKVKKLSQRLVGKHGAEHVQHRDRIIKEFHHVLARLDDIEGEDFIARSQVDLPQWDMDRMNFDEIRAMTPTTNKQSELLTAIQDDIARIDAMEQAMMTRNIDLAPAPLVRQAAQDLKDEIKAEIPDATARDIDELVNVFLPERVLDKLLPVEHEMAKRYVEWLSEGAVGDAAGYADTLGTVLDDMRLAVHKNLTSEYLATGGPYRTVFERALKPMNKVVNGGPGAGGWDFADPTDALALDDLLRSQGHKAPLYVPHIETLNLKVSDFLMPWRMSGMRRAAESGRKGYKRSEGAVFDRWLEGVKDAAVTNPLDAYARRASEIARHKEAIYFLRNLVDEVGRPIEAMDDIAPGEAVLNLDGTQMLIRKRMEMGDAFADDAMELDVGGVSGAMTSAALEALHRLPDEVAEVFNRKGALYAVPKVVAEQMEELMKYRFGYKARLFFDGPLNAWRNLALYFRPAFYMNNFFGNTSFLKLGGGSVGSVFRQALDPKYREMVRQFIGENLDDVETSGFFDHAATRATHFGRHQDRLGAQAVTAVKESRVGRRSGKIRDWLQNINQTIEDAFRREAYMTAAQKELSRSNVNGVGRPLLKTYGNIEKMMEHGADPQKMSRWLEETNKVMNDYGALSVFERNVIRRAFIPFWPFYKHAAKTLFRMPIDHPLKAQVLDQFGQFAREMSAEQVGEQADPWVEGMFPIAEGQNGDMRVFSPQAMNPLSDIVGHGSVVKNVAEQLNPYWKTGIEQATGQNIFTGKPFTHPDVTTGFGRNRSFQVNPEEGTIEAMETGARPPLWQHLLGQIPMVDTAMEVAAGGAAYSADPFTAIPNPDDPARPLYPNDYGLDIFRNFGFPMYDTNPDEYAQKLEEDRMAALSTWLTRNGY